jgi:hypothetical protein
MPLKKVPGSRSPVTLHRLRSLAGRERVYAAAHRKTKGEFMTLISGIGDLLKQYTGNSPKPADVEQHFDQVAQSVPSSSLASGLAEALRSGQTPAFSQLAGKHFASGNGTQQASMLSGVHWQQSKLAIGRAAEVRPNCGYSGPSGKHPGSGCGGSCAQRPRREPFDHRSYE